MATRATKGKTKSRAGSKARATTKRTTTRKPAAKRATKPKPKSKATTKTRAKTTTRKTAASTRAKTKTAAKRGKSTRSPSTSRATARTAPRGQEGLSESTLRAKWINSAEEHEDHAGQTLATRSHDVIRHWVEERGAKPATAPGTEREGRPGVLRFDFPGYGGQNLQEVSWDDWFRTFDERNLVFMFQERTSDGAQSNFFRLDSPQREEA